ncbi:hypothetical protein E2562_002229 [Oryza meyeriana var. granulata]|uniref:PROP1-like PPR domain-containing protein n=1 Tax=Oryza meyeriana var. granulata TaxID=110450 RepID=A0A6G1BHG5_9ORYZ|nr:hypothetical protein E2562_002229 [Oryza meyeriana var. granulata]
MAAPGLDEVMAFLTDHGFASAASALRDDVLARTFAAGDADSDAALDPQLPPLRLPVSTSGGGGAAAASPGSSSDTASSSAFVSMRSSPSGMLNPYGLWSPRHSDASSSEIEFGTARQYDATDFFFQEGWLYDDHLFHSKPELDGDNEEDKEEDKFVLGVHDGSGSIEMGVLSAGDDHRHEHVGDDGCEGCAEVYTCSSPLCGCCGEGLKNEEGLEVVKDSSSTVYGRYQIIDDQTEILDECGTDGFQLKHPGDVVLECHLPRDSGEGDERSELSVVEKELQMLSSFGTSADADAFTSPGLVHDITDNAKLDDSIEKNMKNSSNKHLKESYSIEPFTESAVDDAFEFGDIGPLNSDVQNSSVKAHEEDPETNIDLALANFHREYEVFELRIVHRKNSLPSSHPLHRRKPAEPQRQHQDHVPDLPALLAALSAARTASDLAAALSPHRPVSPRLLGTLLSRLPDARRGVALLDLLAPDLPASALLIPYNLLLRSACRAGLLRLASGLLLEMRDRGVAPDAFSYSTLLAALTRAGHLDHALTFLPLMEDDAVAPDLVLFSNLIHLALRGGDAPRALALFSRLRGAGIKPDLKAYNAAIAAYCKSDLLRDAKRLLLHEMPSDGVAPDAESYSPILAALARRGRHLAAVSLFTHMRAVARVKPDLSVFNIVLNAYGQLDLAREGDRLFWSMRRAGVAPSVVTYNTMLRVYGDAGLFGEAVHLFGLMRSASSDGGDRGGRVKPNVVTYNTMIAIHGKSLEDEKAGSLVQDMQANGIQPNAITYSTILSIWVKAGKLDRAGKLFAKLREAGTEIDPVLYQTMVVAYERAGLVSQGKRLLHDLKDSDNVPKETAIKILASAGRVDEAAWLFRRAADAGEVRDLSVYRVMIDLFAKNRRHRNVVEVFDEMRKAGCLPDSETIAITMNAHGKLKEFDKAATLYREMRKEGCVFSDRVHFQMVSLLGAQKDFDALETLLGELSDDPSIDKRELYLVAAGVYERACKFDESSQIISQIRSPNAFGVKKFR